MFGVKSDDLGVGDVSGSGSSWSGADWFGLAASAIDAGTDIYNNERNISLTKETNAKNESLMRESWLRDDTAVQRRVADLKAAGLSPTLAAGSAAANSGAVNLKAPQSNLRGGYGAQTLAALSAVKTLKNQDLQNQLLKKQIVNYGKPDWFVALHEIFGTERFEQLLHGLGDWLYNVFFPQSNPLPGVSEDPTSNQSNPAPVYTPRKESIPGQVSRTTYHEEDVTPGVVNVVGVDKRYSFEDNMRSIMIDLHLRGLSGNKDVLSSVIYDLMESYGMTYDDAAEQVYFWRNEVDRGTH